MTNQLRSPVLFDTNILFVYISLVTAQIKEVSPEKNTSSSGHFTNCPPPSRILANFSFLRTCQIQFGQGSPLHTDWATFSLWKRCENHFGQEKKLTGHLLQRLPVIEGAALAARLSWWRRDSDLTLYININLWHNEYEIFKPRLCSVIFFINQKVPGMESSHRNRNRRTTHLRTLALGVEVLATGVAEGAGLVLWLVFQVQVLFLHVENYFSQFWVSFWW